MMIRSLATLALAALAILPLAGCSDDETGDPGDTAATLDELWPNEDGRWWRYDLRITHSETLFESLTDPDTPLPSLAELRGLMADFAHDAPTETHDRELDAAFDGDTVTQSGASGQYFTVTNTAALDKPTGKRSGNALLSLLRQARPDLRDRLPAPDKDYEDKVPFSLSETCWEKTESYIGGYGDLDTELSWLFLKTPLTAGAGFTMQLVPQLADDIWLHAEIVGRIDWAQGGTDHPRALEVFTLIDMGVQMVLGEDGTPLGEQRTFMCYRTIYAPGVGPVYVHEWRMMKSESILQDEDSGLIELEAVLVDTGLPEA